MTNVKSRLLALVAAPLFAVSAQADVLLTATYTDWTREGPLSFGLAAMPDAFSATFRIAEPAPGGPIPIPYPHFPTGPAECRPGQLCNYAAYSTSFSSVSFGDATWTTLTAFDFEVDDGEWYLDYAFQSLVSTQTTRGGIVLNGPMVISGTDVATGEAFTYRYATRSLVLTQVTEPGSIALLTLGLAGLALMRRRRSVSS